MNDEERKEVSQIVKRVERKAGERKTPMGKFKRKMADNIETMQNDAKEKLETMHHKIGGAAASDGATTSDNDGDDDESHKSSSSSDAAANNKWGKDLLHKFSNPLATPSKGGTAAGEYFKNFTLKGMHNPLKPTASAAAAASSTTNRSSDTATKIKARQQKFVKAFERSSQSSRDMFQNLSKNFEKSLQNLEDALAGPQQPEPEADYDMNSPEYKMDMKGIALLKEIFPEESTENLIKMHFEHVHASKQMS